MADRRILRPELFLHPRGQILAQGGRDCDDIVIADLDLDLIREVRNTWQFYRDRRPESYGAPCSFSAKGWPTPKRSLAARR